MEQLVVNREKEGRESRITINERKGCSIPTPLHTADAVF